MGSTLGGVPVEDLVTGFVVVVAAGSLVEMEFAIEGFGKVGAGVGGSVGAAVGTGVVVGVGATVGRGVRITLGAVVASGLRAVRIALLPTNRMWRSPVVPARLLRGAPPR